MGILWCYIGYVEWSLSNAVDVNSQFMWQECKTSTNRSQYPVSHPSSNAQAHARTACTILYGIIGACGWVIWRATSSLQLGTIKTLYVIQLILNWSWTPLFFGFHLTGFSLVVLGLMDILVFAVICVAYRKMKVVSLLMIPYLSWILFATYLNFYIWQYN